MYKIKYLNVSVINTKKGTFPKIFAVIDNPRYGEVSFQTLNAINLKKAINGEITIEDRYVENQPDKKVPTRMNHIWNIDQQEKDNYKGV